MLFELRDATPDVSDGWIEVRDAYLSGQSRRAWDLATDKARPGGLATANDYVLNIEIARACHANGRYMALVRMAAAAFPEDAVVRLYLARMLLTRGRQTRGIELLRSWESTLGATHRAWWGTELANTYASAGFEASCRRWLEAVQDEPNIDSALALYTRSCAHEGMQAWDEAIDLARQCVAAAPDWARARAYLANCLLARGRVEDASREIAEAQRRGHEEATVDIADAMLALSLGRFEDARRALDTVLHRWPQAGFADWARRTLCILLVELGEYDAARRAADGREERLALPEIPESGSGGHCFIPLPLIAQNKDQCVPTSVAMAAHPQGRRLDPPTLFEQMHGRSGTQLWRMRQWANDNGFHCVPIRLEKQAVVAMLDRDAPLIAVLDNLFNSHVNVVCGYNDDLDTLYVRDPMHWAPSAWPWEMAMPAFDSHNGLLAVIDAGREDVIREAERWRSDECAALLDLAQAVSLGRVGDAEAAYARVADDSPARCALETTAVHVVTSPLHFRERMRALAEDKEANAVARFRALMSLGSDDVGEPLEALLKESDTNRFGVTAHRYLRLIQRMTQGRWRDAHRLTEQLLETRVGVSFFWELRSDVLAELGQQDASREALDRAIELEPMRMALREKRLNQSAGQLTHAKYLAEFDSLLSQDPDDKRLLWGRAAALLDGPDGRAYQQAALEAIRWFPRHPSGYLDLLNWYQAQGRGDLVGALQLEAHRMLPDIYKPPTKPGDPTEEAAPVDDTKEEELPETKAELLDLVWNPTDPRRAAAVARAIEMQGAGQFEWHEVARLLACRLLAPDERDGPDPDAAALLPDNPPGPARWFAAAVSEWITEQQVSARTALEVNDWLDRVVGDARQHPELWFQRVLLLEFAGHVERALDELRNLLAKHPATSAALYRMGLLKFQQEDYPSARGHFEQTLEVNPGHLDAMTALRAVHQLLGEQDGVDRCTAMLRRKMPFAIAYLRDEVLAQVQQATVEQAEQVLADVAEDFPAKRLTILRSQIRLAAGQADQAAAELAQAPVEYDDDDELFEDWLQAKIDLALHARDADLVLRLCERGLKRWPDSTRLMELQAEQLAATDPRRARDLLRQVLCDGQPQAQTVFQYLGLSEGTPDGAARDAVMAAPEDRREALAELFSEVMSHPDLLPWTGAYHEWALRTFTQSDVMRFRLVNHYVLQHEDAKAIKLAKELYRRHPDSVEAASTLGRCLVNTKPKEALPYLEQACAQSRSADYLFDLARCQPLVGQQDEAQQTYWKVLEQNPFYTAAWTNLFLLGASRHRLWPLLGPIIEHGGGLEDEFFLVVAVQVAVDHRRTLPINWYPLAVQRWAMLKTRAGFRDERPRLLRALLAWQRRRPRDAADYPDAPRNWFVSIGARFWWPRCDWIPAG